MSLTFISEPLAGSFSPAQSLNVDIFQASVLGLLVFSFKIFQSTPHSISSTLQVPQAPLYQKFPGFYLSSLEFSSELQIQNMHLHISKHLQHKLKTKLGIICLCFGAQTTKSSSSISFRPVTWLYICCKNQIQGSFHTPTFSQSLSPMNSTT